jgi:hypothetical protein
MSMGRLTKDRPMMYSPLRAFLDEYALCFHHSKANLFIENTDDPEKAEQEYPFH